MEARQQDVAAGLLSPASFHSVRDILATPTVVPDEAGIYGWWFDEGLAGVPADESVRVGGLRLLYVGIAPSRPSGSGRTSRRTLRDRLRNHTRGPIAHSTLRRTLAVLLTPALQLHIARTAAGKLALPKDQEVRLSEWMAQHARVAWMIHQQPWLVEHALITAGPRLPLNIRDSSDPFRVELKSLRRNAGL